MNRHLLICFEGADWPALSSRIDRGELPAFASLIEQGLCGNLSSNNSLPIIASGVSVATGCHPARHEILAPHLADCDLEKVRPVLAGDRKRAALWEILSAAGVRTHAVGWPASHGSQPENGTVVSNAFGNPCFPQDGAAHASMIHPSRPGEHLSDLVLHPEETDAGMIEHFVPRWREIDQDRDPRLAILGRMLAQTASVHNGITWLLENEPAPFSSAYYRFPLDFEALQTREEADPQEDPFGDPADAAWQFLDLLLGRLVDLAGQDAVLHVVGLSSHPSHPGFLISRGPGMTKDSLIFGANAIDLAPTILANMGFQVERESFDGRVLPELAPAMGVQAEEERPLLHPESNVTAMNGEPIWETSEVLHKFLHQSEGVSDAGSQERWKQTRTLWDWLRARALASAEQHLEALPLLEELAENQPERADYAIQLADSQFHLGLLAEAHSNAEIVAELTPENAGGFLLRARIEAEMGKLEEAARTLEMARALQPDDPHLLLQLAFTLNRLRRWDEAIETCQRVLKLAPDSGEAHLGTARALLAKGRHHDAQSWALEAIARNYTQPFAHLVLGVALLRQGRNSEALTALKTTIELQPDLELGHHYYLRALRKLGRSAGNSPPSISARDRRLRRGEHLAAMRREAQIRETARARNRATVRKSASPLGRGKTNPPPTPLELNAVVGLPGSGLSLVMRMLQAAKCPIRFDHEEDLRWSALTDLDSNPGILESAGQSIFRLPSSLLPSLPRIHYYRLIFVHRPAAELAASHLLQKRWSPSHAEGLPNNLRDAHALLGQHELETVTWLRTATNVECLKVQFADLVDRPDKTASQIATFLGRELVQNPSAMAEVIDPSRVHARSDRYPERRPLRPAH